MRTHEDVATIMLTRDWRAAREIFCSVARHTFVSPTDLTPEEFFDSHAFIAGGAIAAYFHDMPATDIDVFFCGGLKDHGVTYSFKSQGFHFVAANLGATPEEIVNAFDFEHCMYYYNGVELRSVCLDFAKFVEKGLVYRPGARRPGAALLRAGKFQERGWHFRLADAEAIVREIIAGHEAGKTDNELVAFDDYVPA